MQYRLVGTKAIEIYWKETNQDLLSERHAAAQSIQDYYGHKVAVNEGYQTILILLLSSKLNTNTVILEVKDLLSVLKTNFISKPQTWKLPVYYDVDGQDLIELSTSCHLSRESVIEKHLLGLYQVEFIGFLPGFPYLSGLSQELQIPRKQTPSRSIPAGSVAVAAGQCGIYPQESPGGWYVLGRTPVSLFDVNRAQPGFLEIADNVSFYKIDKAEFEFLKSENLNPEKFLNG
ncbi:5-oxoprolinase subunit B family protein [Nonlabens antarcticus]|uniref:5-oxoprolinase subunit B family protein n=1 Tax=Nonlabens antarcticus TaxID=392714 RepID=UPI0018914AE2|nr:carboxyltransferase domain-containing protein [Nonlabens antarcticus]